MIKIKGHRLTIKGSESDIKTEYSFMVAHLLKLYSKQELLNMTQLGFNAYDKFYGGNDK